MPASRSTSSYARRRQTTPDCGTEAEILSSRPLRDAPAPVYRAWEQDDRRYLALDRLDGETLERGASDRAGPRRGALPGTPVGPGGAPAPPGRLGAARAHAGRRLSRASRFGSGHLGHAVSIGEPPPQALQVAGYSAPELAHREPVTGQGGRLHARRDPLSRPGRRPAPESGLGPRRSARGGQAARRPPASRRPAVPRPRSARTSKRSTSACLPCAPGRPPSPSRWRLPARRPSG